MGIIPPHHRLFNALAGVTMVALLGVAVRADEPAMELRERPLASLELPPPLPHPVVGERLSFHGRWFGIPVWSGSIEVKARTELEGHPAYLVEAEGHSNDFLSVFYPIHDVLRSYLETTDLRPLRFEKFQREGHYRADEIVTFDHATHRAYYQSLLNHSVKEVEIPDDVHDLLSAFYWIRSQPVDLTKSVTLSIYSDEKVYRTELSPLRILMVELLWRGTFPCIVIEPKAAFRGVFVRRGRVWCYLSADERRLPLFVKIATPWGPMTGVLDADSFKAPAGPSQN